MPFYEYECGACGAHHEALQKVSDEPLRKCPACGKTKLRKLMSAPVFRLKGSGWYETDFKSDQENKRNLAIEKDEAPKKEESKDDSKKESTATDTAPKADASASAKPNGDSKPVAKPAESKGGETKSSPPRQATARRTSTARSASRSKRRTATRGKR